MMKARVPKAVGLMLAIIVGLSGCGGGDGSMSADKAQAGAQSIAKLAPEVWIKCADEWGTCVVTGTAQVRYGLNGAFITRTATGSSGCNNEVFGDPLPGADKVCEYATITSEPPPPELPPPPPPDPVSTWTKCADEWQTCSFSGTRRVRYGLNGTYAIRTATGSIACTNAVFGDPMPGADKVCEYDGSASSTDCNAIVDQCFDLTATQVTRYRGDKSAAASYTFDDGYPSSATIATIFENRGLRATFFIIPGSIDDSQWSFWAGMLNKGHEIGNHSMTHNVDMGDSSVSDQTLNLEINAAQDRIAQRLGTRPLSFAFPWHSYTQKALQFAETRHISVRKVNNGEDNYEFAFFDQDHAASLSEQLATVNSQLQNVVSNGGWFVAGGHGVDGDGWSPVTSRFLQDHLSYAQQFASTLWIDTYLNVARYRLCRPQVTVSATAASSTQATVHLGGSFNGAFCGAPLTIALPVKAPLNGSVTVRRTDGSTISATRTASKLLFDLRPGETATVAVSK